MTTKELAKRLEQAGFPLAYGAFRSRQDPPFLCYQYVYDTILYADDAPYWFVGHYQVELYTAAKDPDAEARVEAALSGLIWEKEEEYLSDQQVYEIKYEIEV